MIITLSNGGESVQVELPNGTDLGHVRSLTDRLEDIGAPASYTLAVDGQGKNDETMLHNGAIVTFRPAAGEKG